MKRSMTVDEVKEFSRERNVWRRLFLEYSEKNVKNVKVKKSLQIFLWKNSFKIIPYSP